MLRRYGFTVHADAFSSKFGSTVRGSIPAGPEVFVFRHRHGASVAELAVWPRLGRVKNCAAPAAPRHMPAIAGAPHGTHRPATVAVVMAVGATGRGHHHPTAPGGYEVADKVVGEVVAGRFGHRAVVPRASDRTSAPTRQRCQRREKAAAPCSQPTNALFEVVNISDLHAPRALVLRSTR